MMSLRSIVLAFISIYSGIFLPERQILPLRLGGYEGKREQLWPTEDFIERLPTVVKKRW